VGVCCYKQKEWLYRCLRSLASQTYPKDNFEVIVVNDDPHESLKDICTNLEDVLNIKVINNEKNLGLPASLNAILKKSRGQYFVRVDSDDYVSKHFLYVLATFLDLNRAYQAVACDYKKVNKVGQVLLDCSYEEDPIACGVMFSYESLCNVGYYNEDFKMREGHELIKRFNEHYNLFHLELSLYRYRMHENNRTKSEEVLDYDRKLK